MPNLSNIPDAESLCQITAVASSGWSTISCTSKASTYRVTKNLQFAIFREQWASQKAERQDDASLYDDWAP